MTTLSSKALQLFIKGYTLKKVTEKITLKLSRCTLYELQETLDYFNTNNLSSLIDIPELFYLSNDEEVCQYILNELSDKLPDIFDIERMENQKWKLVLIGYEEDSDNQNESDNDKSDNEEYKKEITEKKIINKTDIDDKLITNIVYTDGAYNPTTHPYGWGSVVNSNGKDLLEIAHKINIIPDIHTEIKNLPKGITPAGPRRVIVEKFNDVATQQHNGTELLSMIIALKLAKKYPIIKEIRSDSDLIVKWWSIGHISKGKVNTIDPRKKDFIIQCGKLRTAFEKQGGKIVKISGDNNLADMGWHK